MGTIDNCINNAQVITNKLNSAGIVGVTEGGQIRNCVNKGNISGDAEVGGIVGGNKGTIQNCISYTNVRGGHFVGGIVGKNEHTITDCCNLGTIDSTTVGIEGTDGDSARSNSNVFRRNNRT